jgi:hypothetical protein
VEWVEQAQIAIALAGFDASREVRRAWMRQ